MDNHSVVKDLQPQRVWQLFAQLSSIPRPSGQEESVRNWLIGVAKEYGFEYSVDETGNLVIYKPAQNSKSTKVVLLQAHMDMVTEADPDKNIDFTTDGIEFVHNENWLMADRTTLGSDNGIGLVAIVAMLTDLEVAHPPLQALFTVDEEVGLTGALNLDTSMIQADYVLNLDTEEEGAVYVSSAGSRDLEMSWSLDQSPLLGDSVALKVSLGGLRGGHSGVNIHEDRQNAIKLLTQALLATRTVSLVRLVSINGGNKRNAIPRFAEATIVVPTELQDSVQLSIEATENRLQEMYRIAEPNLSLSVESTELPEQAFSIEQTGTILHLLHALPSGVLQMSPTVPELVQTSNNLGTVVTTESGLEVICMLRSNDDQELLSLTHSIISHFGLIEDMVLPKLFFTTAAQELQAGELRLNFSQVSPGWKVQPDNELIDLFQESHQSIIGSPAVVKAIHAGLECGVILSYLPEAKCISFGPEIRDAHSPVEKLKIDSVEPFYKVFQDLITRLA